MFYCFGEMIVDKTNTLKFSRSNTVANDMDVKEEDEKTSGQSATLYNFGYATKEVIEKFQHFCYNYFTLGEAIDALLKRDKLLKTKYRFKTASVSYQMLARPTSYDRPNAVRSSMLAMHKYTKEGRYKSVADAIEELLLGPGESQSVVSVGVNTPLDFVSYSTITEVEQEALTKIADALMNKLQNAGAFDGEKRTFVKKQAAKKRTSRSPKAQKEEKQSSKSPKPTPRMKTTLRIETNKDFSPSKKKKCIDPESSSSSSPVSLMHNSVIEYTEPPIDIEIVTPLTRLRPSHKMPCRAQTVIRHTALLNSNGSDKVHFMLNMLDLVPSHAVDISSKTASFVVNLEDQ